jgi:hypothetical protein
VKTWPENPVEVLMFRDWQDDVANGDTTLGFRAWLEGQQD